jgi:hypothetical protein
MLEEKKAQESGKCNRRGKLQEKAGKDVRDSDPKDYLMIKLKKRAIGQGMKQAS